MAVRQKTMKSASNEYKNHVLCIYASMFVLEYTRGAEVEEKTVKITNAYLRKFVGEPGKTKKITVGGGLTLWVTVNSAGKTAKTWYLRYYDDAGKQQRAKLSEYPESSLAQTQAQAENAKKAG